jgi:hypothetical protein
MPDVRETVLDLIEAHRPELLLSDAHLHAWLGTGGALPEWLQEDAGEAGDASDASDSPLPPPEERQTDLFTVLPRFVAACTETCVAATAAAG